LHLANAIAILGGVSLLPHLTDDFFPSIQLVISKVEKLYPREQEKSIVKRNGRD
jgi:hypothetical protein